jgi:tRNA threonylcarbamoyladenosine biosynthesis protein TsaE
MRRLTGMPFAAIMGGFHKGELPLPRAALTIALPAPAATKAAGAAFAEGILESSSPPLLITLEGPLGAGKTTFAQGFGEALGLGPGEVASPTFSLADVHRGGKAVMNHLDLYRLGGGGNPEEALKEFLEAGLDECLDEGFSLVEWPERLPEGYWPEERFRVRLYACPLEPAARHRAAPPIGAEGPRAGDASPGADPGSALPVGSGPGATLPSAADPGAALPGGTEPCGALPDGADPGGADAWDGDPESLRPQGRELRIDGSFPLEKLLGLFSARGLAAVPG